MNITYKVNHTISAKQFIDILNRSGLGTRRPVDDPTCIQGMLDNCPLLITAWQGDTLAGVARSVTDFHYACYLSDLAVDKALQGSGIGKQLQSLTQQQLGKKCKLILIAAPDANDYYPHVGFTNNPRCWVLEPEQSISD